MHIDSSIQVIFTLLQKRNLKGKSNFTMLAAIILKIFPD